MEFPKHECSLTLIHNPHRDLAQSPAEWIFYDELHTWKDEHAKAGAGELDSIWLMHWLPFDSHDVRYIAAPTLEELLSFALEIESAV